MRSEFRFDNVDDMEATISITATVKEWRNIAKAAGENRGYESSRLASLVNDVCRQADRYFSAREDKSDDLQS